MKVHFFEGVLLVLFIFFSAILCSAGTSFNEGERIKIDIVTSGRGVLKQYPASSDERGTVRRYIVAYEDERYRIRIKNGTDRRIGLVIAVDGRNILTGKKSYLTSRESMYVLNPHKSSEYDGWRTGSDQINMFYFTGMSDSYAAARNDVSAIGVIAVAVYPEHVQRIRKKNVSKAGHPINLIIGKSSKAPIGSTSLKKTDNGSIASKSASRSETAGTGFGKSKYSPSIKVKFAPEKRPLKKTFIKYEWRSTLCKRGIISCDSEKRENRFWPNDKSNEGYVPFPPGYKK